MLTALTLIAAAAQSSPGDNLIPAYYLTGIVSAVVVSLGGVWGVRRWFTGQRQKWTAEGERQRKHTEAMEANTKAAEANTKAIGALGRQLDRFQGETNTALHEHAGQLRDHDRRLHHVEQSLGKASE
jgi:hypothetical protein